MKVAALLLVLVSPIADACTTFCTQDLFGRNYDWNIGYGAVMVNKRGMSKSSAAGGNAAKWVSRYGSLTFNQYGRDNPTGGMNEAGLVVELMWLNETSYPAPDKRPQLGGLEWIQFQLDTASTVAEVVTNAQRMRVSRKAAPLHFLVADAKGDAATIEFIGGKLVVHRGKSLPVRALANDPYSAALTHTTGRFATARRGLANATTTDAAFDLLDRVAQPHTQWSIVYDLRGRRVTWRTKANRDPRTLALSSLDFGCTSPVRWLDIDAGKGNVASALQNYSPEDNLKLVRRSTRETPFLRETTDAEIAASAAWPDQSTCVIARSER